MTNAQSLHALEDAGVKVEVVAADIGDADDVARVLAMAPRLRGVVHAAGVLDDGMLMQQNAERFMKVAGPKVDGAWHLHSQTLDHSLDFFVLFSSVASVMGSPGQSNYASANAFMDGLAHYRHKPRTARNGNQLGSVGGCRDGGIRCRLATPHERRVATHERKSGLRFHRASADRTRSATGCGYTS